MRTRRLSLPFLFVIFWATPTFAEESTDTLVLGSVTLRLGMSEKEVLSALGKDFELRNLDQGWGVLPKGEGTAGQSGFVRFRDGRLIAAGREWGPSDQEKGVDFARTLIGALSSLGVAKKPCSISVAAAQSENGDQTAVIACGEKLLTISVSGHEMLGGATISEMLGHRR